jgi:hypothetical protein
MGAGVCNASAQSDATDRARRHARVATLPNAASRAFTFWKMMAKNADNRRGLT